MTRIHGAFRHRPYRRQVTSEERRISFGMLFLGLVAIVPVCWLALYLFQWVAALAIHLR